MDETLEQMAHRMCSAQRVCDTCPLDEYAPCATASVYPTRYPQQVQIIRDWAAANPRKEESR